MSKHVFILSELLINEDLGLEIRLKIPPRFQWRFISCETRREKANTEYKKLKDLYYLTKIYH